jgi:hypothetical protein
MNRRTLELLLINYTNINNQLRVPCSEKSKFERLIKETEEKLKSAPLDRVYPDGMTAMEFALHLAHGRNNTTD